MHKPPSCRPLVMAVLLFGLCLAACSGTAFSGEAGCLASWPIEQIRDLSPTGWSDLGGDTPNRYRAAEKGAQAWLRVPAWWNDGERPPKGTLWVFEVTFQDMTDAPVIMDAFGNVARQARRSELHRFGGRGDGQWKVAHVPAGWDQLLVRKGTRLVELGFRAPADVPIARITVRAAVLPADQARWEAESRAWVARAQAPKAAAARQVNPDQTPHVPDAFRDQALVPYVRPYYERIYPNSAPQAGEAGAAICVRMARNEFEPGTFAVYAQQDLAGVEFQVSELVGPGGKLACEIRRHTAEYALERKPTGGVCTWVPQRLWPAFPAEIKKGRSGWFWITVHTLGEASRPGKYAGRVTISATAGEPEGDKHVFPPAGQPVAAPPRKTGQSPLAVLPIEVEVLPITLLSMEEAGLRMGGCVTGLTTAGEMAAMREHNHNMINLWFTGVRPEMTKVGDTLQLDFHYLDEWMALANEYGQSTMVWFLGGDPDGFPVTTAIERELYALLHPGDEQSYFAKAAAPENRGRVLPEVRPYYLQWVREVAAHAKAHHWPELVFTPFDEPAKWSHPVPWHTPGLNNALGKGPWIRDHFKDACALIHEAAPGTNVYISMHHNYYRNVHGYAGRVGEIFLPDCDVICTSAVEEDHALPEKIRNAGRIFWQYSGGQAPRYGFGFYFGLWGSRGSLCWAYNFGARLDLSEGRNWVYAVYSPFETVLTPSYEEMREAWDDRRYLETAKAAAKSAGKDIGPFLDGLRAEALDFRHIEGGDLAGEFSSENPPVEKLDPWRDRLARKIIELTGR